METGPPPARAPFSCVTASEYHISRQFSRESLTFLKAVKIQQVQCVTALKQSYIIRIISFFSRAMIRFSSREI